MARANPFLAEDFVSVPDRPFFRKRVLHLVLEFAHPYFGRMRTIRRLSVSVILALFILIAGGFCLVFDQYDPALVLFIQPTSLIFHVIPQSMSAGLSESVLFSLGMASGLGIWSAVVFIVSCLISRLLAAVRRCLGAQGHGEGSSGISVA